MLPWFVMFMQRGAYRYQLTRLGFAAIGALYVNLMVASLTPIAMTCRLWILFSICVSQSNDGFAYIVGVTMGRTPLISLSPNKTVEGFAGGAIVGSIIQAGLFPYFYAPFMTCP